jgi:hypothetical protein
MTPRLAATHCPVDTASSPSLSECRSFSGDSYLGALRNCIRYFLEVLYKLWMQVGIYSDHLWFSYSFIHSFSFNMLSTNTNPFAEWNHASLEGAPSSILGALPTIATCSSLPVFISDSLVLHFAKDVLNCSVCVNDRPLFIVSSDAQTITFRTSDNQPFALVRLEPTAHVEITGHTLKQRVGDWLRLSPDHRSVSLRLPSQYFIETSFLQLPSYVCWESKLRLDSGPAAHCCTY